VVEAKKAATLQMAPKERAKALEEMKQEDQAEQSPESPHSDT